MKQVVSYGTAYLLWVITLVGSILLAIAVRATYHFALEQTAWHRYSLSAVERFATLFLGLILVVLFIFTEHYFRTSVAKQQLWVRFSRLSAVGLGIFAATTALRVALEWSTGVFDWLSFGILAGSVVAAVLLNQVAHRLHQRHLTESGRDYLARQRRTHPMVSVVQAALALLGGLWLFRLPLRTPLNVYDEGLALLNAERILRGDLPSQDFWAIYPPGQSYALAAIFQIFGTNVMSARLYDTAIRMAIVVCIFLVADRLISRRAAWVTALLTALLLAAATFYSYAIFPAILGAVLAILALTAFITQQQARWLVAGGIAVGITAAFRLDVGFYIGVSLLLGILLLNLPHLTRSWQTWLRHSLLVAGGTLLVMVPFYGYLALAGNAAELWTDLVIFPATMMAEARRLPYPTLLPDLSALTANSSVPAYELNPVELWLLFYLPLVIYPLALAVIGVRAWRRRLQADTAVSQDAAVLAVVILGIGLFNQALSRYDGIHVLPTSLFAVLITAWLLHLAAGHFKRQPLLLAATVAVIALIGWPYLLSPLTRLLTIAQQWPPAGCYATLPRAECVAISSAQQDAIKFVQEKTAPEEPIFVSMSRHDQVFANDISFYFVADRPSATKYPEVHPGLTDTLPVQQAITDALSEKNVTWVVTLDWPPSQEPNRSSVSSGIYHLDDYIHTHYAKVNQYGSYTIWQRIAE